MTDDRYLIAKQGFLAVEFFFIVSGYLLANSAAKRDKIEDCTLGVDTIQFILHKIGIVFPYFISAWFIAFVSKCFIYQYSIVDIYYNLLYSIWELMFLRMSGIYHFQSIGHTWYISAMFIVMILIYPLNKALKDRFQLIIVPFITIIGYGFISHNYKDVNIAYVWGGGGVCYMALPRAFLAISLGCLCYAAADFLDRINFTEKGRVAFTVIECFLWLFVFSHILFFYREKLDLVNVLFIAIATTVSFSSKSYLSQIVCGDFFSSLGKLSLTLYLNHFIVTKYVSIVAKPLNLTDIQKITVYLIGAMMMGVIGLVVGDCVKEFYNKYKFKLVKQMIIN